MKRGEEPVLLLAELANHSIFSGLTPTYGGTPVEVAGVVGAKFVNSEDALAFAIALRETVADDPASAASQPRIALHAGSADRGIYLLAIAHPGQILLSRPFHDRLEGDLPTGAWLEDLGLHRLADLGRPERVWQLCQPGRVVEFPPLRSLNQLPNNLPWHLTSFIGRGAELGVVEDLLDQTRLLTLTGPGGCGKTRLALHAAARVIGHYPDGVWWVDLAPLADANLVAAAVGKVLAVGDVPRESLVKTMQRRLRDKHLLLLLDNCEHVIDGCRSLTATLLQSCSSMSIMTTSREPLGSQGETIWRVPPLSLPEIEERQAAERVLGSEAGQLFAERAAKARPDFRVTDKNAAAVAEVCIRLDGLPLAIELAAARVRALTPEQIARSLWDRFRLLTSAYAPLPHHRTLRATVEWSHQLLTEQEQVLFRRLSVFAGGFTLQSAEEVCWGEGVERSEVLGLLLQLVDRSLIQPSDDGGEARYRLLDSIRHYGWEVLEESGEAAAVRTRHLRYYRALVERFESGLEANDPSALDRMEGELDNLRAALERAAQAGLADDGLRLASALSFFWAARGLAQEGKRHLESLLSLPAAPETRAMALAAAAHVALNGADIASTQAFAEEALTVGRDSKDDRSVGRALTLLGWVAVFTEPAKARPLLEQAVDACRESGDASFFAFALSGLGSQRIHAGEVTEARAVLGEALEVARGAGDRRGTMGNLFRLGWAVALQGDLAEARELAEECLALARTLRDPPFEAAALQLLGSLAILHGEGERAIALLGQSLALSRDSGALYAMALALWALGLARHESGDHLGASADLDQALAMLRPLQLEPFVTWCLLTLGNVAEASGDLALARARRDEAASEAGTSGNSWALGRALIGQARSLRLACEFQRAESLLHQALRLTMKSADKPGTVAALESLAGLAAEQGRLAEAARVFAAAETARQAASYARFPPAREAYAEDLARVRASLDAEAFETAWEEGAALSPDEAISYVGRGRGERKRPSTGWASLTPVELEVVRLVAQGLTNPQIGERLFISKRTVGAHLARIFAKLGVHSRAELAAEAVRHLPLD